jgi:hypothetical protein
MKQYVVEQEKKEIEAKFWRNINRTEPNECWEWQKGLNNYGYGLIYIKGITTLAHRFAWELINGTIPENKKEYHGNIIMHTCDNRKCCNPNHLKLGVQADNVTDMDGKKRRVSGGVSGIDHGNSIFTEEQVIYIKTSPKSYNELGKEFQVSRETIAYVCKKGYPDINPIIPEEVKVAREQRKARTFNKLSEFQKSQIKELYGVLNCNQIARQLNIRRQQVNRVVNKHLK